jgi:hypothetical protein
MEDEMNRSLLAAGAALAITATFASGAQAGCGGGGYGYSRQYSHQSEWRPARRKIHVAQPREPIHVAKADDKPAVAPVKSVAQTENSSIAMVAVKVSENQTTGTLKTVDANPAKVGCAKYFPSVGISLTVSCE